MFRPNQKKFIHVQNSKKSCDHFSGIREYFTNLTLIHDNIENEQRGNCFSLKGADASNLMVKDGHHIN